MQDEETPVITLNETGNLTDKEIAQIAKAVEGLEITPEMMDAIKHQRAEAMRLLKEGLASLPGQIRQFKDHQLGVQENIKRGARPSRGGRIPSGRIV